MNFSHTEHIVICQDSRGEIYIDIDDYELMDHIEDYLFYECGIDNKGHQALKVGYRMFIDDNYSFEHVKNSILKLSIQEIEEIYKLGNPEVEDWEPEKRSITFRDVMEGVVGIGFTVLTAICVGTLSYYLVGLIEFNMALVAAVFTTIFFGFSTAGETPTESVVGILIFSVPAYLFFTVFPFLENFEIDSSTFLLGAIAGIILGWCIAKLFKLILGFFERGKEGRA